MIPLLSFWVWKFFITSDNYIEFLNNVEGKVIGIKSSYIIVKINKTYYYISNSEQTSFFLNQKIIISGHTIDIKKSNNIYEFNFQDYLFNKWVYYQIENAKISTLQNFSLQGYLNNFIINCFNNNLAKTFFILDKDNDLYKELNSIGIGYIINAFWFVFIILISNAINFIKNNKIRSIFQWALILFVLFYFWTLQLPIIGVRIIVFLFWRKFREVRKIPSRKYQSFILFLSIYGTLDPLFFYQSTFWYLLIANIFIDLKPSNNIQTTLKEDIIKYLLFFLKTSIIFSPVQIYFDYRYNFTIEFQKICLLPIFILCNVIELLCSILYIESIINWVNQTCLNVVQIFEKITIYYNFGHQSIILILMIYFSFLVFKDKNFVFTITSIPIILIALGINWLMKPEETLNVLNIGNGQSILYHNKWNNVTIMFDCGVGPGRSTEADVDFLKYFGINKIDYIFISHEHDDHKNALEIIQRNFNVCHVFHRFDGDNDVFKLSGIKILRFRSTLNSSDENDMSSAFIVITKNTNFLITGDITKNTENSLLNNPDFVKEIKCHPIEIMEVAHHGSSTSSGEEFLRLINPKVLFISCERNGSRNFPTNQTVETLKKLNLFWIHTQSHNICFKLPIHTFEYF